MSIYLGFVSTEGGPLLLADATVARKWRGIEEDEADYQRAVDFFDERPLLQGGVIDIDSNSGILWELGGAGSCDVISLDREEIVLVRSWADTIVDEERATLLADYPLQAITDIGVLDIVTGVLAIMWATETGACIESLTDVGRPTGDTITEESALLIALPKGVYKCLHDNILDDGIIARRCHLVKV